MVKVVELKPSDIQKYNTKVQNVVSNLSKKGQSNLGLTKDDNGMYLSPNQYKYIKKRWILKENDKVIGFFDILMDGDPIYGNITFAISESYQGKGYGTLLATTANKWIDKHLNEFDNIVWGVKNTNNTSIKLAKKCGFVHIKTRDEIRNNDKYLGYVKSPKIIEALNYIKNIELR